MHPLLQINDLTTVIHTDAGLAWPVDGLTLQINERRNFRIARRVGLRQIHDRTFYYEAFAGRRAIVSGSVCPRRRRSASASGNLYARDPGATHQHDFSGADAKPEPCNDGRGADWRSIAGHFGLGGAVAQKRILEILNQVGIPDAARRMHEYPFQFSGGMKQRMMIAMALAGEPELLIADEPTTALDVTIQAQVLELMRGLQDAMACPSSLSRTISPSLRKWRIK